ncbi:hypothetical protein D3C76_610640 [compost metagenome]
MAGADQGDLWIAGIAEKIVATTFALGLGDELIHVLDGIAGAAQLPGDVVQGAGLAHASGFFRLEFALGNIGETGDLLDLLRDDFRRALGTVRRPVLVATEVEVVARIGQRQLLVGQGREVRYPVAHLAEAREHGLVVLQRLVVVEGRFVGGRQLAAVDQATGRLVDDHQLHALGLESIVQLLHTAVAGRRGVEFGAQVFAGTEQPVAFGLYQGSEVLLVARGVAAGIVGLGAQVAARLGGKGRRLYVGRTGSVTGRQQGSGQAGEAE